MNDDDLTTDLGRELRDRSDAMHGTSLGLADVQQKARSIRRRRTVTAVGGAVAAIALIVPTAALANHHGGRTTEPLPATQSVTPTPSPTTSEGQQPPAGVLDVSDLPTGDAPRVEYVTGGNTLHQIDGSSVEIPTRYPVNSFVVLTDGSHIWLTRDNGTTYVEVQDLDGTLHDPVPSVGSLAVNPSHSIAAWVTPDGQVMVWTLGAKAQKPLGDPLAAGSELRMAAVTGDDCALACTVYVNVASPQGGDAPWEPWEVSASQTQLLRDGGYLTVSDISRAGVTIGLTKITDIDTCSKVLGGGEFAGWSTCKNQLASFSTEGGLVLATPTYYDGLGPTSIAMYAVSGGPRLFERRSDAKHQAFYAQPGPAWEDEKHLLASVFQDGRWSIVRIAADGTMEYAVPPIAGADVENPFVLATGGPAVGD